MVDPKGIFQQIKRRTLELIPDAKVFAFGSRVRGESKTGKWDFDIYVYGIKDMNEFFQLKAYLDNHFINQLDENNKLIKIDLFKTNINTVEGFSNFNLKYVELL